MKRIREWGELFFYWIMSFGMLSVTIIMMIQAGIIMIGLVLNRNVEITISVKQLIP